MKTYLSKNEVCYVVPYSMDSGAAIKLLVPDKVTGVTEYTKHYFWSNNN